jgi:hypothetical protein
MIRPRRNVRMGDVSHRTRSREHRRCATRRSKSLLITSLLRTGYATSELCPCASFAVSGDVTGNCSTVAC